MTPEPAVDDHDHQWTYCENCPNEGGPCICAGGRCADCPALGEQP